MGLGWVGRGRWWWEGDTQPVYYMDEQAYGEDGVGRWAVVGG